MNMRVIFFLVSLSYVFALEDAPESNPSILEPAANHLRNKRQFYPGGFPPPNPPQNFPPPPQQQPPGAGFWGAQNQNSNGFAGQQLSQNGQGQGQGQSSSNQLGNNLQQQSSGNNQQTGSASSSSSSNSNQPVLWNSNQNDYQCVINNCRGQNLQWNPICGTDNLVYDNVAVLRCAQQCGRRISFSYSGTCVVTTTAASRK
ncbi:uncharacterized protein LOC135838771 [Planococcus citri]|uniref:uncharacterized protein LOC135838771 n=1 Tax=Planococcus citri TaxID=170843 RepID=UPI0031F96EE2